MKRALRIVHWAALVGAVAGAALFAGAWFSDDLHILSDYGLGSGPARHSGYGALAEALLLALPAAVCLLVAWITTLVLHATYDERVLRRTLWATAAIGVLAATLAGFEGVLDALNDHARKKEADDRGRAEHLAGDHDGLAAYASAHDLDGPMTPGGSTPLHAAVVNRFPDLVTTFIGRGAVPSEDDLDEAARRGDIAMVHSLFARHPPLRGSSAISDAFSAGDTDMLSALAAEGADVAGALPRLIDPQSVTFHPGEVDWQTLRARWREGAPEGVARTLRSFATGAPPGYPVSEGDVLVVLTSMLGSMELCLDPAVASLPLEPWMRETRLCTCNYCPYARQINWAILAALYRGLLPALEHSKHFAMLHALARQATQANADPRPALRTAVANRNVPLLEILEEEGFDVRVLGDELAAQRFLSLSDEQRMRSHLVQQGVHLGE